MSLSGTPDTLADDHATTSLSPCSPTINACTLRLSTDKCCPSLLLSLALSRTVPEPITLSSGSPDSLIATCVQHPRAAGQVFLAGDGEDVSTAELLRRIAQVQEQSARLLWCPVGVVELAARLLGKGDVAQRLLGSLQVDISKNRNLLGWQPLINLDEGLRRAVQEAR